MSWIINSTVTEELSWMFTLKVFMIIHYAIVTTGIYYTVVTKTHLVIYPFSMWLNNYYNSHVHVSNESYAIIINMQGQ